jgi:hypothetical protein
MNDKLTAKEIEQLKKAKEVLIKDAQIIRKDGNKRTYTTQSGTN